MAVEPEWQGLIGQEHRVKSREERRMVLHDEPLLQTGQQQREPIGMKQQLVTRQDAWVG